jgi:hypothetical protein
MDEKQMILKMVEQYAMTGREEEGGIKVQRVQDQKTTYVEPGVDGGRSVYLNEYKVNGKSYWAGYSSRSNTVYVSLGA